EEIDEFQVHWRSPNGDPVFNSDHFTQELLNEERDFFTAQLLIKNYLAKDNGTYVCVIKNRSGAIIAQVTLEVEEEELPKEDRQILENLNAVDLDLEDDMAIERARPSHDETKNTIREDAV
ncbi:unnamed protein product, partial [Anisakis simplex]|uniref:Ig-like domain-containing protein n=1 Tax=Anisakis simplex TaxID=6269 RepID=A0A0M3JEB9_ANISI